MLTLYEILFGFSNQEERDGLGNVALWGTCGVHTRFCWGDVMEIDRWEGLGVGERIILKMIYKNWDEDSCGLAWDRDRRRAFVNAVTNFRIP